MFKDWKYKLKVVLTSSCWRQFLEYSDPWDRKLNQLFDNGSKFIKVDDFRADFGDVRIWVANYPYETFVPNSGPRVRPKRSTILKLRDKLIEDYCSEGGLSK